MLLARYRKRRRSPGCQDVVPNANDVVGSHLTRDYPLNGGLRPGSGPAALAKPVITKLTDSLLNCICRANAMHFVRVRVTQLVRRREVTSGVNTYYKTSYFCRLSKMTEINNMENEY